MNEASCWEIVTAIATLIQLIVVVLACGYTIVQIRQIKTQLKQSSAHSQASLSNQENWSQFDRHERLPPAIPSWKELTDSGWAWRVIHLNHLNLLKLAHKEFFMSLMDKDEFDGWIQKAKYRFRDFWCDNSSDEVREGREILRQLLIPEEGFSREFTKWLVDEKILPPKFIPR